MGQVEFASEMVLGQLKESSLLTKGFDSTFGYGMSFLRPLAL